MGDIEEHVYARLLTVCHLWPGITPWNVWDLPFDLWLAFAATADDYQRKMEENRG